MEKFLAVVAHVSYLIFGAGFLLVPAIIYLYYEKKDDFIAQHALEAVKVQGFFLLTGIITMLLCACAVGVFLLPIWIVAVSLYMLFSLYAGYKALIGESYRYPRPW